VSLDPGQQGKQKRIELLFKHSTLRDLRNNIEYIGFMMTGKLETRFQIVDQLQQPPNKKYWLEADRAEVTESFQLTLANVYSLDKNKIYKLVSGILTSC